MASPRLVVAVVVCSLLTVAPLVPAAVPRPDPGIPAPLLPEGPVLPLTGPSWHPIDSWRQPQGLPQNTIITLLQSRDGYMWIGTKGGVTRFDGVRFTTFEKRAVSETEVWELDEGHDGSIWIATYGAGLHRLKASQLVAGYSNKDGLASNFVMAVCEDAAQNVWAGTDKGVSRLDLRTGKFETFTKADGLKESTVNTLLCEPDGSVWFGTSAGGLHKLENGKIGPNQLTGAFGSVSAVVRAKDGALWVGAGSNVLRLKGGQWRTYGPDEGLDDLRGLRIHADNEGAVWVGSGGGIYSTLDATRFERHDIVPDRTQKQTVTAIWRDHEGSLWLGHSALILARLRRGYFATYNLTHGLIGAAVRVVFEDREGTTYIGTNDALNRLRDGKFQRILNRKGDVVKPISSITEDAQGYMWFGTPTGMFRFKPKPSCGSGPECREDIEEMDKGELSRVNTRVVFADSHGNVWLGTDQQGLARYHEDTVTTYTTQNGLCDNGIRGIAEAPDGTVWIGTKERGVCLYKDGRFTPLTEKDGLASDLIQGLYRGRDGSMWIQTRRGINRRLPDGKLVTYTVAEGLYADHVYGMAEDHNGAMWMGCSRGAYRVSMKELDDVASGRARTVTSKNYGIEDGLKSTVMASGFTPTVRTMADGRVWMATTDGVSVVDPKAVSSNQMSPPVHVEEVVIDRVSMDTTTAARARPGEGEITFRYSGLSFVDPQKMKFKVRLEPHDRDWVDMQNLRIKQYTNLPPGGYRFRVKAANTDGVWNEAGDQFELYLAPHFYQTWWFMGLCVVGIVLAAVGAHRWRIRFHEQKERELQVRVDQALAQVKTLSGMLPICASCKKIRDDSGYWNQMETYIHEHSGADFSHSVCPECLERLYPDYAAAQREAQ